MSSAVAPPVIVVTGSSGHLGEALLRTMRERKIAAIGVDLLPGEFTDVVGDISDSRFVDHLFHGVITHERGLQITGVINTAVLHKPHIVSHAKADFVAVNITGTLNLLNALSNVQHKTGSEFFIQTSTTSTYGDSLKDATKITWITESIAPSPKNIYGVTKRSAEDICELFAKEGKIQKVFVLQASRFFPEADDDPARAALFKSLHHSQIVELLHRRVEIQDLVDVHLLAVAAAAASTPTASSATQAATLARGVFKRYISSAPTPFRFEDLPALAENPEAVVAQRVGEETWKTVSEALDWSIPKGAIDRVYCSHLAVQELGWNPKFDAKAVLEKLAAKIREAEKRSGNAEEISTEWRSDLALKIGWKGYHRTSDEGKK